MSKDTDNLLDAALSLIAHMQENFINKSIFRDFNKNLAEPITNLEREEFKPGWEPNVWHPIELLDDKMKEEYQRFFIHYLNPNFSKFAVIDWYYEASYYKDVKPQLKYYMLPKLPEAAEVDDQ